MCNCRKLQTDCRSRGPKCVLPTPLRTHCLRIIPQFQKAGHDATADLKHHLLNCYKGAALIYTNCCSWPCVSHNEMLLLPSSFCNQIEHPLRYFWLSSTLSVFTGRDRPWVKVPQNGVGDHAMLPAGHWIHLSQQLGKQLWNFILRLGRGQHGCKQCQSEVSGNVPHGVLEH